MTSNNSNKDWKKIFSARLFKFALLIIRIAGKLPKTPAGFVIAQQIIKSGTSIGANYIEAQNASSLKHFIEKLSISLREAEETTYWLLIIKESSLLDDELLDRAIIECGEITAILISSLKSSKLKLRK